MFYTRKPTQIEAMQFSEENGDEIMHWAADAGAPTALNHVHYGLPDGVEPYMQVLTPNGYVNAEYTDWIAKDPIPGFYYPIKASVFSELYDPLVPADTTAPLLDYQEPTPQEGANVHGIGPDTDGGPNPDYVPPVEAPVVEHDEEDAPAPVETDVVH